MDAPRDDLDDRLRQLAAPNRADVERIVAAVLTSPGERERPVGLPPLLGRWSPRFVLSATCLVAAVAAGVWWIGSGHTPYVPEPRVSRPAAVLSVASDDGGTVIFSTTQPDDWPPPGSGVVFTGGDSR